MHARSPTLREDGLPMPESVAIIDYLDDIFPTTIGKPLFGGSTRPTKPQF